ncbi:MAG: BamA/TamA family outer membrane protein [Bacteroidales bacterium]|nr:BamA/TamA family outer membrane protein [Bacteroidales bacterium]
MKIRHIILPLLCTLNILEAQGRDFNIPPTDTTKLNIFDRAIGLAEKVLDFVTYAPDSSRFSFAIYPAASYGHRTGFEVGLMPIMQAKSRGDRQSSIVMGLLVSTKKMWEIQFDMDLYPSDNTTIIGKVEWMRLPDEYYGAGSGKKSVAAEMMTRTLSANPSLLVKMGESDWEIGPVLRYYYAKYSDIISRDIEEQQIHEMYLNASNGSSFGLGGRIRRDTRNDNDWPTDGSLLDVEYDYWMRDQRKGRFATSIIDYRKYIGLSKTVLAGQAYLSYASSKTPYHLGATFGGTRLDRAVGHNLKYLGQIAWFSQLEWRVPLFWRIGGVIFAGAGNAEKNLRKSLDDIHGVMGLGLRFKVFPKSGMNIRLDYGKGSHGDDAIYLSIKEGF